MTVLRIIAVNYNGAKRAARLVESLIGQKDPDWQLIVVDNSESSQETARLEQVSGVNSRVAIFTAPSNLGYLHAAEWWISHKGRDLAAWTAVSNTDLYLNDDDFVGRLRVNRSRAAVLAPNIVALPSGRQQNPYMKERPTRLRMLLRRMALSRDSTARLALWIANCRHASSDAHERTERVTEIYAPHGSFMIFADRYFEAGGNLVHGPFLFAEELTVAERVRDLGLSVEYQPDLRVTHEEHQSTSERSPVLVQARREAAIYGQRLISGAARVPGWRVDGTFDAGPNGASDAGPTGYDPNPRSPASKTL